MSVRRNPACPKGHLPAACWLSVEPAGRRFAQTPALKVTQARRGGETSTDASMTLAAGKWVGRLGEIAVGDMLHMV